MEQSNFCSENNADTLNLYKDLVQKLSYSRHFIKFKGGQTIVLPNYHIAFYNKQISGIAFQMHRQIKTFSSEPLKILVV